jgi:hypothetical protein
MAGNNIAIKMPMMAMTTKSSTSVNADRVGRADRADRIEESNRIFRFMPSHPMVQVVSGFAFFDGSGVPIIGDR